MRSTSCRLPAVVLLLAWLTIPVANTAADDKEAKSELPAGARMQLGSLAFWHTGYVTALAYSPDGKLLASAGADNAILLWDVATGKKIGQIGKTADVRAGVQPFGQATTIAFAPDGKAIALLEMNRTLSLLEVPGGKKIRDIATINQPDALLAFAFSPDGKTVATGTRNKVVTLWEVESGKEIRKIEGLEGPVTALTFLPDSKAVVCGVEDSSIRLFAADTGKELRVLEGHRDAVRGLSVSADGKVLASASSDGTLRVWDLEQGKTIRRLTPKVQFAGQRSPYANVFLSSDGKRLVSAGMYQPVQAWEVASGKQLVQVDYVSTNYYSPAVALAPDGKTMAAWVYGARISLYEMESGRPINYGEAGQASNVSLALSPDGKTLAAGGSDRVIRLWDLKSGKLTRSFEGHVGQVSFLSFSGDGKLLASASSDFNDRAISLWDVEKGQELKMFRSQAAGGGAFSGQTTAYTGLALSPDGKLLTASTQDGFIRAWEVESKKELYRIPGRGGSIALSRDGKTLLHPGNDASMRLSDAATGKEIRSLGQGNFLYATFAPDGKLVAALGYDGHIRIRDASTGRDIRLLDKPDPMKPIYRTLLGAPIAFSADGRVLACSGPDSTVRMMEVATGQIRFTLEGHPGGIQSVAFAPDGRTLVTAGAAPVLTVWDASGFEKLAAKDMSEQELAGAWKNLADADGSKAFAAMKQVAASPKQTIALFKEKLQAESGIDQKLLDQLITDLDSEKFQERKKATEELERLGEIAQESLQKVLQKNPSLEVRQRIESILKKVKSGTLTSEQIRSLRAIEILERLSAPESKAVLEELAKGSAGSPITRSAKDALTRLEKP